jgi:exodeoxyribonuclease VII small subunit
MNMRAVCASGHHPSINRDAQAANHFAHRRASDLDTCRRLEHRNSEPTARLGTTNAAPILGTGNQGKGNGDNEDGRGRPQHKIPFQRPGVQVRREDNRYRGTAPRLGKAQLTKFLLALGTNCGPPNRSFTYFLTPATRLPHSTAMNSGPIIEEMSFEHALKELEQIVTRLESGDEPLDNSITLYERGSQLRQRCTDRLNAAQARIEAIRLDSDGRPTGTTPFAAG